MNITANDYNSIANHNLSSVLSQIQDNGPAYAGSTNQRTHERPVKENMAYNAGAGKQQRNELYDDTVSISSGSTPEGARRQSDVSVNPKKEISPGVWLQLLLLLISAALLASTLFRLDAQTNTIENSLSVYDEKIDEKIQESVDLQRENTTDGTTGIKVALQSLQKELQLIKTDYSALDKKYVEMAQNKAALETKNATAQEYVSTFKYEILSLKSELQTVKDKLKLTGTTKQLPAALPVNNGLTVALASLTNREKAEKIVQQLYAEGLQPSIKQAVVNGERVYRLSVSGFYDRSEAESFIRKADKKYGMKDSRIRKS